MADFKKALKRTLKFEGGYVSDPDDPGGSTCYGITQATARKYGYNDNMRNIPMDLVEKIYKIGYWNPNKLEEISNQLIAENIFDAAVNCGVKTAAIFLQKTLNELSNNQLQVDGEIGSKTLNLLFELINKYKEQKIVDIYIEYREKYYDNICEKNKKLLKYRKGWHNRSMAMKKAV